jgi:hypothetical protein
LRAALRACERSREGWSGCLGSRARRRARLETAWSHGPDAHQLITGGRQRVRLTPSIRASSSTRPWSCLWCHQSSRWRGLHASTALQWQLVTRGGVPHERFLTEGAPSLGRPAGTRRFLLELTSARSATLRVRDATRVQAAGRPSKNPSRSFRRPDRCRNRRLLLQPIAGRGCRSSSQILETILSIACWREAKLVDSSWSRGGSQSRRDS